MHVFGLLHLSQFGEILWILWWTLISYYQRIGKSPYKGLNPRREFLFFQLKLLIERVLGLSFILETEASIFSCWLCKHFGRSKYRFWRASIRRHLDHWFDLSIMHFFLAGIDIEKKISVPFFHVIWVNIKPYIFIVFDNVQGMLFYITVCCATYAFAFDFSMLYGVSKGEGRNLMQRGRLWFRRRSQNQLTRTSTLGTQLMFVLSLVLQY